MGRRREAAVVAVRRVGIEKLLRRRRLMFFAREVEAASFVLLLCHSHLGVGGWAFLFGIGGGMKKWVKLEK